MATYHINLSEVIFNDLTLYSGSVMKLKEPSEEKNTISFSETIGRETKNEAIYDILHSANKLDYQNNRIIFTANQQQLASFENLQHILNDLIE